MKSSYQEKTPAEKRKFWEKQIHFWQESAGSCIKTDFQNQKTSPIESGVSEEISSFPVTVNFVSAVSSGL